MLRIISLLALFITLSSFDIIDRDGSTERIHLQHRHKTGNHIEYYPPADMPEAFFNSDDMEIIIEAVIAGEVLAGRQVDSSRTNGDVTVKEGAEYEIEAAGEVKLAGGFTVEKGAAFAIRPASF